VSQDYRVGVGDTLEIQVVDAAELTQTLRVSAAGDINFLPVGATPVAGLTAAEVEAGIGSALQGKRLLRNPQVLVFIKAYQAKRIYVMGEVVFPGELIMSQNLTVMDAILLAGGLSSFSARYGYLHRHVSKRSETGPPPTNVIAEPEAPREGTEIFKIDLQPFQEGKVPEPDLTLQQGDYLIVPARIVESVYVLGAVKQPFHYDFPTGQTLMVSQAISLARGPDETAKPSKTIIVRKDKKGKQQQINVDFPAIIKGEKPDIEVLPDDIVYVPRSKVAIIREGYVAQSDLFAEGVVYKIGRYYQLPEEARHPNPRD
jgi:polysaccharide export outer membrane protein